MKIVVTHPARRHFRDSLQVIAKRVQPKTIAAIRTRVSASIKELANNPGLGQLEESLEELELGHRRIIQDYFKIVYRVEGSTLWVTDIFDTRQDPRKLNP